jgi:hypothetical protein
LPLVLVAGSCGGYVHWTPPFLVDLVYHISYSQVIRFTKELISGGKSAILFRILY